MPGTNKEEAHSKQLIVKHSRYDFHTHLSALFSSVQVSFSSCLFLDVTTEVEEEETAAPLTGRGSCTISLSSGQVRALATKQKIKQNHFHNCKLICMCLLLNGTNTTVTVFNGFLIQVEGHITLPTSQASLSSLVLSRKSHGFLLAH